MTVTWWSVVVLAAVLQGCVPPAAGHGRLIEPPSRASAWRYGFSTPPNYNDHELYCGGFARQWQRNEGRCGVCGDAWDMPAPRPHELGGAYGQGVIVRRYRPGANVILRVELTANHNGHFEFRVCTNHRNTTQACLDKHVLHFAKLRGQDDPLGYRYYPRDGNKIYEMRYRLPDVTCNHCVLQWIYRAGNNWGKCVNGTESVGCGPQEEFRACADIAIGSGTSTEPAAGTEPPPEGTTTAVEDVPATVDAPGHGLTTLVVAAVALLLVVGLLALLFTYYYQVGKRVKSWLKGGKSAGPPPKPVPPPRARRTRFPSDGDGTMYNVSLDNESIA